MIPDDHVHVLCEGCMQHCSICGEEAPAGLVDLAMLADMAEHPSQVFAMLAGILLAMGIDHRDDRVLFLGAMAYHTGRSLQKVGQ